MATLPRMPPPSAAVSEASCRSLYVGNLDPRVTDAILAEIFRASATGEVLHVKIIPDKNMQHGGLNYGFVDFADHQTAESAIQSLNGRKVFDREIKVNWAYQGSGNTIRQDISNHHHVFVGDLCPDITDAHLHQAFCTFGSLSHARVIHDLCSRKSRGYGFLAFRDRGDAERAIATMNGIWLGSRTIRVNWATQKTTNPVGGINTFLPDSMGGMGGSIGSGSGMGMNMGMSCGSGGGSSSYGTLPQLSHGSSQSGMTQMMSYESILSQCSAANCTVYFGNLAPTVRESDIMNFFQAFGYVVELRHQPDRGYAFVRMDAHDRAAMAIFRLQGAMLHGRSVKISWGKDKFSDRQPGSEITSASSYAPSTSASSSVAGDAYDAYTQYYKQQAEAAAASAAAGQQQHGHYGYPGPNAAQTAGVAPAEGPAPVDPSTLPHLSDPIAAAAAAAAQAAVAYQRQHQTQALAAALAEPNNVGNTHGVAAVTAQMAAAGTVPGSAESYSNDYYAYYYQYYYNQQQQQQQQQMQYQANQGNPRPNQQDDRSHPNSTSVYGEPGADGSAVDERGSSSSLPLYQV